MHTPEKLVGNDLRVVPAGNLRVPERHTGRFLQDPLRMKGSMTMLNKRVFEPDRLRYLQLLSQQYPTVQAASTEIIRLQSILNLPKGTEHFMS